MRELTQELINTGVKELRQKNWSAALNYFQATDAWFYVGYCYDKLGRWQEAIEAYKKAIRIKPDYAEAHCFLGIAYDKLGRYEEAIEAYKQAIRIKPDYAEAHWCLGVAYDKLGRYGEAIEAYKQAIRIKPDYAEAHNYLGIAYASLAADKNDAQELFHKGLKEVRQGNWSAALTYFQMATEKNPDNADAWYYVGYCYDELGRYQEAIESFKQAIKIKPDYAGALKYLDVVYDKLGRGQEAIEKIHTLVKKDSDLPTAARLMTIEFRKDIDKLLSIGIKIDKGALVTKTGGILGAGAAAYSGHWIAALAIGVASLFADTIGDSYKKIKLREFQLKWLSILNRLDNNQRAAFLSMLEINCPMISARQLPYLLSPSEE